MCRTNNSIMTIGGLMQVLVLLAALGAMCGCASTLKDKQKLAWSCDEQADVAVAQGKWQQALEQHEQLLSAEPQNCLTMYHVGYIWGKLEDRHQEVTWYEQAVACGYTSNDVVYFNMGMAYADLGQTDKAIVALNHAIQVNPHNAENHFGLALTARAMGDELLAEHALVQAIEIDSKHWDARILLAKIYLDQGRMDAARTHLQWVLDHAPENEAAIDLWRLYQERIVTAFEH